MPESEYLFLTSQDIQESIQNPLEEVDMFTRMAGSLVSSFDSFKDLPIDAQQEIFNYLHTFSFIAFGEYYGNWRRTKASNGGWKLAADHIQEIFVTEGYPTLNEVTSLECLQPYDTKGEVKMGMIKATTTIFEMNLHEAYDLETLEAVRRRKAARRRNHHNDPPTLPGKQSHTNEEGPPSTRTSLS
jgi:hypothetical protein